VNSEAFYNISGQNSISFLSCHVADKN